MQVILSEDERGLYCICIRPEHLTDLLFLFYQGLVDIRGRGRWVLHLWIPQFLDFFGFLGVPFLRLAPPKQGAGDCILFYGELDAGAANNASLLPSFSYV